MALALISRRNKKGHRSSSHALLLEDNDHYIKQLNAVEHCHLLLHSILDKIFLQSHRSLLQNLSNKILRLHSTPSTPSRLSVFAISSGFCLLDMDHFCVLMIETFQQTLPPRIVTIRLSHPQWNTLEDLLIDFSNQLTYLLSIRSKKYMNFVKSDSHPDSGDSSPYLPDPTQPQFLANYAQTLQNKIISLACASSDILVSSSESVSLVLLLQATEAIPTTSSLLTEVLHFFASYLSLHVSIILTHNNSVQLPFPLTGPVSDKIMFISPIYQTVSPAKMLDLLFLEILAPRDESISLPMTLSTDCLQWIRSEFMQNEFSFISAATRIKHLIADHLMEEITYLLTLYRDCYFLASQNTNARRDSHTTADAIKNLSSITAYFSLEDFFLCLGTGTACPQQTRLKLLAYSLETIAVKNRLRSIAFTVLRSLLLNHSSSSIRSGYDVGDDVLGLWEAVTGKTNDSTGELKIKSIINILKSHFQHQLADIGPTVDEWAKLLTSKSTDVKLWTDQLTSFHHSFPDPNLQELPFLITIHDRLLRLKDSILTQSSIFLRMIESLQPLCDPLCPQSDIPYTALVPEFESDMQDVDLKYLITLLVNEINDWICTSVLDFLSPEIFDGHSFSHLERMMTIGDDSLTRLAVAQRLNSNIRYGTFSFMKKNQFFSDTTLLVAILREFFDTSRKEVPTEMILQRFTAALNEQTSTVAKDKVPSTGRKKRQRDSSSEVSMEPAPATDESRNGTENPPSKSITDRYLTALSELQRLGYLRLTSSGHQIKKLMVWLPEITAWQTYSNLLFIDFQWPRKLFLQATSANFVAVSMHVLAREFLELPCGRHSGQFAPGEWCGQNFEMTSIGNDENRIKTAVRIRPLSKSEEENQEKIIASVDFQTGEIILLNPIFYESSNQSEKLRRLEERKYLCDIPLWSVDKTHPDYSGQCDVFNLVGKPLVTDALEGLNCSLFAYGQTGSGKTYTMMGDPEEQGVIPRFCSELFTQLAHARANSQLMIQSTDLDSDIAAPCLMESKVEVSYYEIYNERIYDLLSSTPEIASKVREHPTDGAFVEGLTLPSVTNYDEIAVILEEGHSKRQVAETLMNATSSRSHAVFTLYLTQKIFIPRPKSLQKSTKISEVMHRKSKVNLIDLAGSERLNSTGASGDRLKEATNINRSLFVLGEVIKTLAENSEKGGDGFVPYRNSLLTWILKDSLGGNSKTTMLATVSPIGPSYAESTNTLRYIERAKLIASKARINDDNANDPYIKHLQQQVALYKGKLSTALNQLHEKEVESEKKCQQFIEEIESLQSQLKEANRLSRRLSRAMSNEDKVRNEENAGAGADSVGSPLIKAPSLRSLESASSSGHLAIKLDEEEEDVSHLQIDMLAADSCHSSTDGDGDPTLAIKLDSTDDGLTPSKPYRVPTIRNLATEVRQLQEALALSMQECEEARQRLIDTEDSFRLEVEYLQERVQVGEVELSSLRESLKSVDSLENQTSIDHVTICQLEENIAGLNSIIETLQLRVTHKDNEIQELKESNRIALSELRRTMDHAVKDLQHQCDTKTLLLGDQSNQIASLHAKLQTFDESFTLQSQEHRALTSRYEQAILDLKELLEQTDLHYRDSLAVLEENLASARSDNERLQQALLRKDHEMEANEQKHSLELDDLCNEIEGMKHLINQRIEQYEAKLDQKNEEIDRLQLQLSAIVPVDSGNELAIAELNSLLELRNQTIEGLSRQSTLKDETISDLRAQLLAATNRIQEFEQKKSESPTLRPTTVRKSSFDRSESANLSSGSEITKRPLPRRSLSSAANYEKLIIQRLKSQLQEREEELQNIKLEHEKDILEFCDEVVKLKSLVDTKVTDFGQMKARHEEIIVHSQLEVEVLKKELNDVQHLHEVRLLEVLSDIETLQEDIRVRVGSISSERTARDEEAKNELPFASESGISAAVTSPTSATSTLSVSTRIRDRIDTFPTSSTASSPRNSLDCDSIGGGGVTSPSGSVIKLETEVMKELKLLRCRFEEQEKTHEAVRSELQNQLQASQEEQQRSLRRIEELEKEKRAGDEEMRRKVEDYEKRIHDIESERNLMKAQLQSRIQLTDDPREVHGGNGGGAKQGKKGGGFFFCGR